MYIAPHTGSLEEDQRQQHHVRQHLDRAGIDRRQEQAADDDARHQAEDDGQRALPDAGDTAPIDEQRIDVDDDFDEHQGGVEYAVGVEEDSDRHGEGREAIADGAIDGGGEERDDDEDQR